MEARGRRARPRRPDGAIDRVETELADEPAFRQRLFRELSGVYDGVGAEDAYVRLAVRADSLARASLPPGHPERIDAACRLGWSLRATEPEQAETLLRECVDAYVVLDGPDAVSTAEAIHNLGYFLRDLGRLDEADSLGRRAIHLFRRAGPDHGLVLVRALEQHALTLVALGQTGEAVTETDEALGLRRQLVGADHPTLGVSLTNAAMALSGADEHEAAARYLEQADRVVVASLGPEHPIRRTVLNNLALERWGVGQLEEAEVMLRDVLALNEAAYGDAHEEPANTLQNLGRLVGSQGRIEEAEALHWRAYRAYQAALPEGHFQTAFPLLSLADYALDRGDAATAERLARQARQILDAGLPEGHWIAAYAGGLVGRARAMRGDVAEARPLLRRSCEALREVTSEAKRAVVYCSALADLTGPGL